MRKTVIQLFLTLAVACSAATAFATQYPAPGCSPCDTLGIVNLQDATAIPHPIPPDTVYGVRGIVIGFDDKGGKGIYIETRAGGNNPSPFVGLDLFTGTGAKYVGYALGDSVAAYGKAQEFPTTNGITELEGFDTDNTTQDLIVRKITSLGTAGLPKFHVGTVPELKDAQHGGPAEQWENMLVKIRTPMKVVRSNTTGSTSGGLFSGQCKVVPLSNLASTDSVLIDGGLLGNPTVLAPAVGTVVDSVQGIFQEGTLAAGGQGYEVCIRDANDMFAAVPPNLADVIPIEDNQLRVVFDRPVTQASAEDFNNNYSLLTGTVTGASQPVANGSVVNLTISGFPADGAAQSLTSENIVSFSSNLASTAQTKTFFQGVQTIANIEAPDAGTGGLGGTPCVDRSRFAGTGSSLGDRVSFRGVVTGINDALNYIEDATGGNRSGVIAFSPSIPLTVGHKYLMSAGVQEFFGATEVAPASSTPYYIVDEGVATLPTPRGPIGAAQNNWIEILRDSTCDAGQSILTGEDFEETLVNVPYAKICGDRPNPYASGDNFRITNVFTSDDTMLVDNDFGYVFTPDSTQAVSVTGLLRWNFGEFRLIPRNDADIHPLGAATGVPGLDLPKALSFAVTPNPGTNAHVSFGLPQRANVDLAVYDLQGRQLAVLARGEMPAGSYSRTWDGRSSSGDHLGSGVYFYRLKVGDEVRMIRAVRLSR